VIEARLREAHEVNAGDVRGEKRETDFRPPERVRSEEIAACRLLPTALAQTRKYPETDNQKQIGSDDEPVDKLNAMRHWGDEALCQASP
jgi:hypothetical protein